MNIDIRTLSLILSVSALLQITGILMQYLVNKTYKGIGWWLAGYISIAAATVLIPVREIAVLEKASIMLTNFFQLSAFVTLYIGLNKFFNKKENRLIILLLILIYPSSIAYFTFVDNNLTGRIILNSFTTSYVSFLLSYTIFRFKSSYLAVSANLISVVFFVQGNLFLARGAAALISPGVDNFFTPSLIQVIVFVVSLININLWMSGFIIMINQRLSKDIIEARDHFEMIFNTSPDAAIISRLDDGVITDANDGFIKLSGLEKDETFGRSTSELNICVNNADRDKIREELFEKGFAENIEVTVRHKNGSIFSGLLSAKVITLDGIPHVISLVRDITLRKQIEDKLIRAIDEVIMQRENAEKLNHEKELLLREVHHRIKNNMNTIIGLLSIQTDSLTEPSAIAALKDTGSRVRSMMMLYDKLYKSEGFLNISLKEYLHSLVDEIAGIFPNRRSVKIEKNIADFMVDAETLFSLGIIINEIITNTMKYAFTGIGQGIIKVSTKLDKNHVTIILQDNGIGLPDTIDIRNSTGFGLQLVRMLTEQIGGSIDVERSYGTIFTIEFNLMNSAENQAYSHHG